MNEIAVIAGAILLACCGLAAGCGGAARISPQPASAVGQQWVLQDELSDEFNGQALDLKKWDNDVADWGVWSWEPENVWIENGLLKLRMHYKVHERQGQKLFYTSGIIKSKAPPIKYGCFEARIKAAPLYPGVCPAFWAYRTEKDLWTEIDFVELTERSRSVRLIDTHSPVFRHPKLAAGTRLLEPRTWEAPWDPRDAFHVYGCEWDEAEIKWFIDGQQVASRKNEFWHQPLDVVVSLGVRSPLKEHPSPEGFPTAFEVDYVRVWKVKGADNP